MTIDNEPSSSDYAAAGPDGRRGRSGGGGAGNDGGGRLQFKEEGGFLPPLTRVVCTPCYRAPEVVMSRGGYSSAIDMWSLGCIYGELLQRVSHIGSAATPQLQVAPVFAMTGQPLTPATGDHFTQAGAPGNPATREELQTLFSVIGTPAWSCIDAVPNKAWQRYLYRIPGRAPSLYRRFGAAGEVSVDLLSRLLTFDPARRCLAEEAMAHEYFSPYHAMDDLAGELAATDLMACDSDDEEAAPSKRQDSKPLIDLSTPIASNSPMAGLLQSVNSLSSLSLRRAASGQLLAAKAPRIMAVAVAAAAGGAGSGGTAGAAGLMDIDPQQPQPADGNNTSATCATGDEPARRFWEISEAAMALATLESELAVMEHDGGRDPAGQPLTTPMGPVHERMREMLEHEVDEHAAQLTKARAAASAAQDHAQAHGDDGSGSAGGASTVAKPPRPGLGHGPALPGSNGGSFALSSGLLQPLLPINTGMRRNSSGGFDGDSPLAPLGRASGGHPVASGGNMHLSEWQPTLDPAEAGYQRIPFHADAEAASIEPEKHLRVGRHGEWCPLPAAGQPRPGPTWGVTVLPPGLSEGMEDTNRQAIIDVIRSQHAR